MTEGWTFGRKLGAGFAVVVLFVVAVGVVSNLALERAIASKDGVIQDAQTLVEVEQLNGMREMKGSAARGFLLTGDEKFVTRMSEARGELLATLDRISERAATDEGKRLLGALRTAEQDHHQSLERVIGMRRSGSDAQTISAAFERDVDPTRTRSRAAADAFVRHHEQRLEAARQDSSREASRAEWLVAAITIASVLVAGLLSLFLTRGLARQIGTAVGQVQSSSTELQAAANQQATASREQSTAMNEISTTISELLVTSRQIAESAQRVAQIAQDTASNARTGEKLLGETQAAISQIQRQVELVVGHMLELGRKSQQIGAVVDIVSELAEQTNILAINASIEAAGAGESGKRFGVVADEIRKLADRVGGSTKEIRTLIDDVRSAVNTTVMATETGSKAVDAGSRQFADVASAFGRIASLVATTTEAAREIELSTKQQSTAVEQVNVAIASVAQASKETEVSSGQTLGTAAELASLSNSLLRLVRPAA